MLEPGPVKWNGVFLLKVLMLTPTYYPIISGSETAMRLLAMGLNSNRIQTDVMTLNMDKLWLPKWTGRTEMSDDGSARELKNTRIDGIAGSQ